MNSTARHVIWTDAAVGELEGVRAYTAERAPMAAARLVQKLLAAGYSLEIYANRYRASGRTRELVTVRPYVIRYRVESDVVLILAIRHAARHRR